MAKFITISKYPKDPGQITTCNGTLFVTSVDKKQNILCFLKTTVNNKTVLATTMQELAYRSNEIVSFIPVGAAEQGAIYPGTDMNPEREKTWMYATDPMSISGMISNGEVVATSSKGPLILYYSYASNQLKLSIYNLQDKTTTIITSKTMSNINGIESCQFLIGSFASTLQQDILVSCNLLNLVNVFFTKEDKQNLYQLSDRGLGNWCSSNSTAPSLMMVGDFNGDKLSDLLCLNTRYAMINKKDSFRETYLVRNQPGNWVAQFNNSQRNLAIGDFDSNGLSDFVSLTNNAQPEILFNNGLSEYGSYYGNSSHDGSFVLNSLEKWCGTDSKAQMIAFDADNDGKDDILCKNNEADIKNPEHGKVYLAISRTAPYRLTPDQTLKKIKVTLNNFNIGENIGYFISDKNVPLFCDASKIYEYHTKLSCSLNSPNKIVVFTNPVTPSNTLPELVVDAEINGNIDLGDKDKYGDIDLINEQIYNNLQGPRLLNSKFWKWENVNYVDNIRQFKTKIHTHYIRQGKIKEDKQQLSDHSYGYKAHGGDCNEIQFSHITLVNKFTAIGRMEAYNQNNNHLWNSTLLRNLAEMYILPGQNNTVSLVNGTQGNVTNIQINKIINVGGGAVTFSFSGEITLQTLYQKNVTHCSIKDIKNTDLADSNGQGTAVNLDLPEQSAICLLQDDSPLQYTKSDTQPGATKGPVLLKRSDLVEINGVIHAGGSFFPDSIKNKTTSALQIDRYGVQITELHSRLNYNDSTNLNAYVRGNGQYFDKKPHNELMIDFTNNTNTIIYQPTRIKNANGTLSTTPASLYAGFDNIKLVKLAAFDSKHILLAWSIYQALEKQYYLLVDYVNTGNSLLKIPLYEQYFNITIANKRYGNEFYISYKSSPDKLVITKYSAETFSPTKTIEVDASNANNKASSIESYGDTKFELQVEESSINGTAMSSLIVSRNHNNHQGKFIQRYNIFLGKNGTEANIICDITNQNHMTIPAKIDEGYDVLRLENQQNSKVVYHSTDRNYNLDIKIKLQNSLNFINRGLNHLLTIRANPDKVTQSKVKSTLESIICKTTLSYDYSSAAIKRMQNLLSADLTYEIHSTIDNTNCKSSGSYYPAYRIGNVVHLCPGFDTITDSMSTCNRLVDLSEYTKGLLPPELAQISAPLLSNLLPYFPSNVITGYAQIFNSDYMAPGDKAAICHGGGAYGSQALYVNNLANIIVAGLVSLDVAKNKISLGTDSSSCNNMAIRGCSTSYDKQANNLCLSDLLEIASIASLIAEAAQSNENVRYNCQTGCDLKNPALAKLTRSIGGYLATNIDKSFVQTDSTNILRKMGIKTTEGTFTTSNDGILTASPAYFYDKNSSLIAFAYLGNDFIDLKAQYFRMGSADPISVEQHLGRFSNVRQIQVQSYNQSAILIGYSVNHPSQNDYNILIQYITPTTSRIVNIYPSYNGIFSLNTVPYSATQESNPGSISSTEFVVSYPTANNQLTTKRYKITPNIITEQLRVDEQITAIPASAENSNQNAFTVSINAFLDKTFNIVWSNLDQTGIFIQGYNLLTGSKIGTTTNLATELDFYPQVLRVNADNYNKTIISWQNNNDVYVRMISPVHGTSYQNLNFTVCNLTLQGVSILDSLMDVASLKLIDNNNASKTVLVNAISNTIVSRTILNYDSEKSLITTSGGTASAITTISNAGNCSVNSNNIIIRSNIFERIPRGIYINILSQSCSNQDIQYVLVKAQHLLNNKLIIFNQLYSVLDLTIKQSLSSINVSVGNLYEVRNPLADSVSSIKSGLKTITDPLYNIDIDSLPNATISLPSITEQDITNLFNSTDPQAQKFKAQVNNPILDVIESVGNTMLSLINEFQNINIPTNEEDFIEFVAVDLKNKTLDVINILHNLSNTLSDRIMGIFENIIEMND